MTKPKNTAVHLHNRARRIPVSVLIKWLRDAGYARPNQRITIGGVVRPPDTGEDDHYLTIMVTTPKPAPDAERGAVTVHGVARKE